MASALSKTLSSFSWKICSCFNNPVRFTLCMPCNLCGSHQLHRCLSDFTTRAGCPGFVVLKGHMASPAPRQ
eukprot:6417774-Pyramimonas_sp.AAC.1